MTRSTYNYPPTSAEALTALVAYHNQATLHRKDPAAPEADLALLLLGLPQGPISSARVISDSPANSPAIAFTIKDRNERTIDPEGFLMLRVLILFGMGLFIDKNQKGGEERHYVELGHEGGITLLRLLADAYAREVVRQQADHHDLRASALAIVGGKPTVVRGRREALAEALKSYDTNAVKWGLSALLSRPDYQPLVRGSFRLFDLAHGHMFLRTLL
ncbi:MULTISPECIES: hypothetical protein [unclassified Mesorhizobium]|uniref:hypothetical protein n=1 Tax=unclassified Mesorhizobium TaxID=325217 RepID=UPI00112D079C|nr:MULTISPECIES: hypothetical protein [unclassified Mesorhizobium]TPI44962.1 hypothetical protein FJW11_30020 [Mesorhizobium sp. B3-1-1]TPJ57110.1 hypothetical protein FJ462_32260 [Mesorhizobium sp. B2-6-7]TPJ75526.1 hypothetical protein FJ422_31015 [Mesorhizobium sp. B2-6-3]TPJ90213.1 hypothetical protein FJ491_31960 [Mesorhizobium sp. B2-5-10]TPK03008.1 hypothetical protein FJ490_32050 [Mesorhizobium sp. B2-5-11]